MSSFTPHDQVEIVDRKGWVKYGVNNNAPQYYIDLFTQSALHHAICIRVAQMIAGQGHDGQLITDELIDATALDIKIQGGFYWEVILSMDKKTVAKVNHLPFEEMRMAEVDANNNYTGAWHSADWESNIKNKPKFVPIWNPKVLGDADNQNTTFVYICAALTPGSKYYPSPDYIGAKNWIELDNQISIFHVNNIQNGMFPSFIVDFFNGDPDVEARNKIMTNLAKLQGGKNAGKYVVNFNPPEAQSGKPIYTTLPVSDADKVYAQYSEMINEKILVGHGVTSPLLFGMRGGDGFGSNKDELLVATDIFTKQVIRPYQRLVEKAIFEVTGKAVTLTPNVPIAVEKIQPTQPATLKMSTQIDLTDDDFGQILDKVKAVGEVIDLDEWELIDEADAGTSEDESRFHTQELASHVVRLFSEYAEPEKKSEWGDSGLYKLRYKYNGPPGQRSFCRQMMQDSDAGTVYRYEDIAFMSLAGVNSQFAPKGEFRYNLFDWKGGVYCHHNWKRQIYFRKRKGGKFLPNDGLNNDKLVGNVPYVPQKGKEGTAPIDTPSRGKLNQ